MRALEEIYKGSFFKSRRSLNWRVPIMCNAIIDTFEIPPLSTIIDVGCAIGDFVDGFYERGYKARGIEGSGAAMEFVLPRVVDKVIRWDLRKRIPGFGRYDLCICLEVAEHIEPEYTETFLDNLCLLSDKILMTAAPPGQEGVHHVNCQPQEYWEDKMLRRGYQRWRSKEIHWLAVMSPVAEKKGIGHYRKNAMIYRRTKIR